MSNKRRTFNHGDYEYRKQQAIRRLGNRRCPICGETDWRCMDLDHVAGQEFDPLVAVICANCHRKRTDAQKDHPQRTTADPPDMLERIGHMLLNLAEFFVLMVERLREFGLYLIGVSQTANRNGGAQ